MKSDIMYLAEVIKEKIGIDMTKNTDSLHRKVSGRLSELNQSIWGYIQYIKHHPEEWENVIDYITINETYFFREEEQLEEYQKILKKMDKKHIRIWSAACSMGEEAYSLAIVAKESLPVDTTIEIIATDINHDVLSIAKKGLYSKNSLSFRRMAGDKIKKYFDEVDGNYQIKKEYKDLVQFKTFNLVDESKWFLMNDFDVIFCRNVLIYFDEETNKEVVERFYSALGQKGTLFLGHSDPYRQIYEKFTFVRTPTTLYLKKGEE